MTGYRFLYYEDGGLIGYLALYTFGQHEAEVSAMTHPQRRRKGIFTRLLAAAGEELRKRTVADFLFICEQGSPSGAGCMEAIGAGYASSEYRMDLVEPVQPRPFPAGLEIRPARPEDVGALAEMDAICFGMSIGQRSTQLARFLADGARQTLVATMGPAKIGKIHVTDEGDGAAYISTLPPWSHLPPLARRCTGASLPACGWYSALTTFSASGPRKTGSSLLSPCRTLKRLSKRPPAPAAGKLAN